MFIITNKTQICVNPFFLVLLDHYSNILRSVAMSIQSSLLRVVELHYIDEKAAWSLSYDVNQVDEGISRTTQFSRWESCNCEVGDLGVAELSWYYEERGSMCVCVCVCVCDTHAII